MEWVVKKSLNGFMVFLCSILVSFVARGEDVAKWQVGQALTPFSVADQHDNKLTIDEKVKWLIVARDMDASKLVAATLEPFNQAKLNEKGIVYLADVSRMPGLILKFAALPKMRKLPYSILLDREGDLAKAAPVKEKHVTLLSLSKSKILSIQFFSNANELRKNLFESP